jgi:hypothetical protein
MACGAHRPGPGESLSGVWARRLTGRPPAARAMSLCLVLEMEGRAQTDGMERLSLAWWI